MKSHEKNLLSVCRTVLLDAAAKCYTVDQVSIDRDLVTIEKRVLDEGLSFLTITLPTYGKEFERALDRKVVDSTAFPGWKRWLRLPAFLRGFVSLVFDAESGRLLDEPDLAGIEGIRQIAYTFKKLHGTCTDKRIQQALWDYEEVESDLSRTMLDSDYSLFSEVSRLLWGNVFSGFNPREDLIPKHGPGQTSERISGNRKYVQRRWHERLESLFPIEENLMCNINHMMDPHDGLDGVELASEEQEYPVRVATVPKTMKGPRIIAMEPVCMQYAQQAVAAFMIKRTENHWITKGHVNFSDQKVNRDLAVSASIMGDLATLDLSSASDRVPLSLVKVMLNGNEMLLDAVLASRSKAALLPDGRTISLRKFASMGSALCFPVEACYFFTGIITALLREQHLSVTLRNIHKVSRSVYVYGDDIIVPVDMVEPIIETLTGKLYCKVNTSKSFWNGNFRESCGMDAFRGECVTPTYLHYGRPVDRGQSEELISLVATCNLFYKRGYWRTSALIQKWVESLLGDLPIIRENAPCLGWLSYTKFISYGRWSKTLHRFEVKSWVVKTRYRKDYLDGWSALLKYFILCSRGQEDLTAIDEEHLERSPRSGTSSIKRRWTAAY